MTAQLLALLLGAVVAVHGIAPQYYSPQVTIQQIPGRITSTTFTLDPPNCVFLNYQGDALWLQVSFANNGTYLPPAINSPYSARYNTTYYMTFITNAHNVPCPPDGTVVRIGTNTACPLDPTVQDCNGPLSAGASYRVRYIAWNANQTIDISTRWSEVITLKTAQASSTLDTWPGRRSAAMVIITTILSVLLAIILAALIATLVIGRKMICNRKDLTSQEYVEPNFDKLKRYTSHQVHAPQPSPGV